MCSTTQQNLKTISEIATETGKASYAIAYIVTSRKIPETRRVGIIRLFDPDAVEQIKMALAEIGEKQTTVGDSEKQ